MRIVHAVGWYFPENIGGTEVYVAAVARELRRAGVDVQIAAPAPGTTNVRFYEHEGIPVVRYPTPANPTRAEARGDCAARGAEQFHDWLESQRPDIVHIHTFVTGLDFAEVDRARHSGARVFVTSHSSALGYICIRGTMLRWGSEPCDGLIRSRQCAACVLQHRGVPWPLAVSAAAVPAAFSRAADRIEHPIGTAFGMPSLIERRARRQRELLDRIEGFFALTDAARSILIANGAPERKVSVNRLGIDTDVLGPASQTIPRRTATPVTIGYLGRLDPIKGLDDLLQAVKSLSPDVPVRFEIRGVGDDAEARRLLREWKALAARDDRITVGAFVSRQDVAAMLSSWDLLCCPGRSLEGGPTVALEAFAVGTPVIGTRFGGLAELVTDGENGRLVAPRDWRALASVIREVAYTPGLVDAWRQKLPPARSMRDVTADYLAAYHA